MKTPLLALATVLTLTAPTLAQFPPPGIHQCVDATGTDFGTLTLLVAGDYVWQSSVLPSGKGQVASAGSSVNALTGSLADIHLKGSFSTKPQGEPTFLFATDRGKLQCDLPAL